MHRESVERFYGEEFFMRVTELPMPWKKGPLYILVELVLRHSETSYRFNESFWCAIEDTFDRALVKACIAIKAQID